MRQVAYSLSLVTFTDYACDRDYYYGIYSAEGQLLMLTSMHIKPNADILSARVGINLRGKQHTLLLSRTWRCAFFTAVGPLLYNVVAPYRYIYLRLDDNEAGF